MDFVINGWVVAAIFFVVLLLGGALAIPGMIALSRTSDQQVEKLRSSVWSQAQAEIEDLRRELQYEGTKRRQLEDIVAIWSGGINLLLAQLRQLEIVPVWEPPTESMAWLHQHNQHRIARMSEARLIALIDNHFNLEEIDAIACDLNIDPENIPGRTKLTRIRALVDTARRLDRLMDLYTRLSQLRPTVAWPNIIQE